jgi:kojibiose phosphorylase
MDILIEKSGTSSTDISTWKIVEAAFQPEKLRHKETIFTIGNGYLSTRGVFEEGYPD